MTNDDNISKIVDRLIEAEPESPSSETEVEKKVLLFGTLPSKDEFLKQFSQVMKSTGNTEEKYPYVLGGSTDAKVALKARIPLKGPVDGPTLYAILVNLVKAYGDGDDDAGNIAASFMKTLSYDWT